MSYFEEKYFRRAPQCSRQACVLLSPTIYPFSGTQLSSNAQTAAAIITLLNAFLVSKNKPPLGFLNYWLYEAGLHWDGINDVTSGHNPGCNTEGFYATDGWDPVRPAWPLSLFSSSLIQSAIGHRPRVAELYITRTTSYYMVVKITNIVPRLSQSGTNLNPSLLYDFPS